MAVFAQCPAGIEQVTHPAGQPSQERLLFLRELTASQSDQSTADFPSNAYSSSPKARLRRATSRGLPYPVGAPVTVHQARSQHWFRDCRSQWGSPRTRDRSLQCYPLSNTAGLSHHIDERSSHHPVTITSSV